LTQVLLAGGARAPLPGTPGLFETDDDGRYSLTALGELLRSDVEGLARRAAIIGTDEWCRRAYGHLNHSLLTGEPGFYPAHGCGFWQYLAAHPDEAAAFDDAMSSSSRRRAEAFAQAYDFDAIARLVDVGGGQGVLLRTVLEAHPHLRGVVYDLPPVIEQARRCLGEAGLPERCKALAGDFFESVPSGGDAYLLSWILHDRDDRAAARILANCRAALGDRGRLLLIEMVLPSGDQAGAAPGIARIARALDLQMLVLVGGRERTAAEYRGLLEGTGFTLTGVLLLEGTLWSGIEAVPA
jgi:hypothetical protein